MATMTSGITTAPVASAATYVNPNAGNYASYTAGEYAAGKPVATFSSALFNQTWQPVTNKAGQSQYDISRTTAETAGQRAQALRQEALGRQLGQQGLSNSGIALKQGQLLTQDIQSAVQSGIAGVNQAELAAAEANRQAALGRQYGAETLGVTNAQQTGERLGAQAFAGGQTTEQIAANKELTYADLNFREQQLSQQANQFTSDQDFKRWAIQAGYSNDEIVRSWTANENEKNRKATKEVTGMQITSTEKIANANIVSNEKINANKDALTAQGLSIDAAKVYGFTDPATGQHVMGSLEIAAGELGLKGKTLEEQQKELWGWTDAGGVRHAGKYDLLDAEGKRAADALYGANIGGKHIRGSLENDSMIADLKARETQVGVDSFYGYTDASGNYVKGSGQIAADAFGLKSRELADQEAELFGYVNPTTGEFVPGKMELLTNEDKRAAANLYGYEDPFTGQHVMGTLELQADKNTIERQGLTIQEARVKGYTNSKGEHVMGELELGKFSEENKTNILKLEYQLKSGLMDKQQVIDTDKLVQQERAERYYNLGKSGVVDPPELNYLLHTDPLAYEAYMAGKAGKTFDDVQRSVDMTNKYRATQIENLDDPATQEVITKMFASWGVESAAQDLTAGTYTPTPGTFGAKDFASYDMGRSVLLDRPTISSSGKTIPPGTYTVSRVSETRKGKWDPLKQDWLQETGQVTYLTDASGNKIEAQFDTTATEKAGDWWNNCANPLSADFWQHPFGIK